MKTIIHVNKAVISHNVKYKTKYPVYRVLKNSKAFYCNSVTITGKVKGVTGFDKPLKCGAKVWMETSGKVTMHGVTAFSLIKENMKLDKLGVNK